MNIDFPKIDISGNTEIYPEGVYKVRIDRHEPCTASTGTEQIRWFSKVTEGEFKGKSMVDHTPLTEASQWKIGSFIHHSGIDIKKLPKLNTDSTTFQQILNKVDGREMYWYVIQSVFNGKTSNKVQEYKRVNEDEPLEEIQLEEVPEFLK
ncbi:hypothetical protein LCGC14_2219130 [marine sediment metagenome]|uniref:DUF669 domain-containing protein n=1 Tax=marine sediment metagenome TaxID=412755 RepID=A0A0F9G721_9ZZZZ